MSPSIQALEDQYFLLRGSLPAITSQGANADQLAQLQTLIVKSRDNYWTAARSILQENDPRIQALVSQLETAQLTLTTTLAHLGNVVKVLDTITRAVSIGSELVGLAVAL